MQFDTTGKREWVNEFLLVAIRDSSPLERPREEAQHLRVTQTEVQVRRVRCSLRGWAKRSGAGSTRLLSLAIISGRGALLHLRP